MRLLIDFIKEDKGCKHIIGLAKIPKNRQLKIASAKNPFVHFIYLIVLHMKHIQLCFFVVKKTDDGTQNQIQSRSVYTRSYYSALPPFKS